MNFPKELQFKNLETYSFVKPGDKQYNALKKIHDESSEWTDYINYLITQGVSIRYDYSTETFSLTPFQRQLTEGISIEDEFLGNENINVLKAEDVVDLIKNVLPDIAEEVTGKVFDRLTKDNASPLTYGKEDLKQVYGKGQETLDTDFKNNVEFNDESLTNPKNMYKKLGTVDSLEPEEINSVSAFDYVSPDDEYIHPDLYRIGGEDLLLDDETDNNEYGEKEILLDETTEDEQDNYECNKTVTLNSVPVKLILSGILITESELKYISEEVEKSNNKLVEINGRKNEVNLILENHQVVTIEDVPNQPAPFIINGNRHRTLTEALLETKKTNTRREKILFEKVNSKKKEEINTRKALNEKLDHKALYNSNYQSSWTIRNLGFINLKNGLNEAYSSIISFGKSKNTLAKNSKGEYILFRGNVKEQCEVGKIVNLNESKHNRTTNLGNYEIVGLYENSLEGLGEVMFETKKSVLPLYVWEVMK